MIRTARRPAHDSSARAAVSTESQPSGIEPSAAVNADCKWLSRVVVFASQLSARYQATGTLAEVAKPASSVLLPEPAGATTSPRRCCQMRARSASTRSRERDCTWGISTFADTTAVGASLTLATPHPTRAARRVLRQRDACADPFNVLPATVRRRARYFATLLARSHLSIWLSQIVQPADLGTHVCSPTARVRPTTEAVEMSIGTPIVETVISKDGTRIGWARSGDGPPLVLVHGTTATARDGGLSYQPSKSGLPYMPSIAVDEEPVETRRTTPSSGSTKTSWRS